MRAIFIACSIVLAFGAQCGRAGAVTIVLGNTLGHQCYEVAETADAVSAFDLCSAALGQFDLLPRDRAATYVNRSVVRLRSRDYNGAIHDCDESIAIAPYIGEAYVDKGAALIALDRPEDAVKVLDQGIAAGFDRIHLAYFNRAMAKEKMHDFRGAFADYKKAQEIAPSYVPASEELKRFIINGMM